jgi:hypothetical protein
MLDPYEKPCGGLEPPVLEPCGAVQRPIQTMKSVFVLVSAWLTLTSSAHALDLETAAAYAAANRGEALVVLQDGKEVYARGKTGLT